MSDAGKTNLSLKDQMASVMDEWQKHADDPKAFQNQVMVSVTLLRELAEQAGEKERQIEALEAENADLKAQLRSSEDEVAFWKSEDPGPR